MNALEMKQLKRWRMEEAIKGGLGRRRGVCVGRWGCKAATECVIEFFPFPASVWARMRVWPSVLGADTEVSVWKDAVSPFRLPSQTLRGATPALLSSRHPVCPPVRSHFSRSVKAKITQLSEEKKKSQQITLAHLLLTAASEIVALGFSLRKE